MDLINRQAVIDMLATMQGLCGSKAALVQNSKIWQQIKDLPSAEPVRMKGKWIETEVLPKAFDVNGIGTWASKMQCDQCEFITYAIEGRMGQYNFYPNCGARMSEGEGE